MKILVLSAYHATSHQRWVRGLVEHLSDHDFEIFDQPPRHFPWRSRGNSLYWAFDDKLRNTEPDLVVATSMVDLAGLRGMVPHLSKIPTLVYFHENQFAYPTRDDRTNANLLVTNLYTALAADRVVFNSPYNRTSFLRRADAFLDRMPDQIPDGVIDAVDEASTVIPVPLDDALFDRRQATDAEVDVDRPLRLVWNHRWEYDKAPDRFFRALFELEDRVDFRLVVLGQQFRQAPPIFAEAKERLSERIDHWGWVDDRSDYLDWLRRSDLVVSTAIHDFQGLAVQEAVALGCLPVLPDRVAYPDFFDDAHLYPSSLDEADEDVASLARHLDPLLEEPASTRRRPRPEIDGLRWSNLAESYRRQLRVLHRSQPPNATEDTSMPAVESRLQPGID